jgi:hypothetical protein
MAIEIYERFSSFGRKLATEIASIISIKRVSILFPKEYLCGLGRI